MQCLNCHKETSNPKYCSSICNQICITKVAAEKKSTAFQNLYFANPKSCPSCKIVLPYKKRRLKFCSHSCAASCNNAGIRRHGNPKNPHKICKVCGAVTKDVNRETCGNKCAGKLSSEQFVQDWLNGKLNPQTKHGQVPSPIRKYLFEIHDDKCQRCRWGEMNRSTNKIPLQVHHEDGDHKNNRFSNLLLLCPNCHSLTINFGSLNKGKGRSERQRQRKERVLST